MPRPLPKNVSLGRIIATRRFTVRGKARRAELRIGAPRTFDGDAYCPVQLVGIGEEKVRPIFGVDRVQALQLAMRLLETLLLRFDELLWQGKPAHETLQTWSEDDVKPATTSRSSKTTRRSKTARPQRAGTRLHGNVDAGELPLKHGRRANKRSSASR